MNLHLCTCSWHQWRKITNPRLPWFQDISVIALLRGKTLCRPSALASHENVWELQNLGTILKSSKFLKRSSEISINNKAEKNPETLCTLKWKQVFEQMYICGAGWSVNMIQSNGRLLWNTRNNIYIHEYHHWAFDYEAI